MDAYTQTLAVLLVAIFVPTAVLTWLLWPRKWRQVFRGGEVAICLAFAFDSGFRLALICLGNPVPYPGVVMATISLALRSVIAMLIWGRVSQLARHRLKSKEAQRIGIEQLRSMGADVSRFEKKRK